MPPMIWAIVGVGLASAFFFKLSKGPTWKGWNTELFGDDDEYEDDDNV